ncbi:MAG TPA: DUF58 domain-containing protein [Candidatus Udaeobacter sp.]|nr:DUF58 domain-containing protein [Candidatus Udaeobacter sp.]
MPWLYLLSAWLFALAVAMAGYAYWNRGGLRLRLEPKSIQAAPGSPLEELPEQLLRTAPLPAAIFEGDALELSAALETTGAERGPASVTGLVGAHHIAFSTGRVSRTGWHHSATIPDLHRGPLGAASWEITTGDFLGFFRDRRECDDLEVALVLPRFESLTRLQHARELEAGVAAPRAGSGTEMFGVREYRPGDSRRRIHWRSSARHGELIVREYEPPGIRTVNIYLDAAPGKVEVADQIARLAASEAWDSIRAGGRAVLWAPGSDPTQASRDLWALLEWLARYPYPPRGGSEGAPGAPGDEVVVVTASDQRVVEAADVAKARGARVRAWVVGSAQLDLDVAIERVGTAWPL